MGVPFILDLIVELIVIIAIIAAFFFISAGMFAFQGYGFTYSDLTYLDIPNVSDIMNVIILFLVVMIFAIIISMLINAFFEAGAIGMAKQATEEGKTKFDDMIAYGRKKFISLFLANIILNLILIGGIVIIAGIVAAFILLLKELMILNLLTALAGVILCIIYFLTIEIIFYPVKYALVISDLGTVEGIKKGYRFFMNNKLNVFLLWLIVLGINIAVGTINFIMDLFFTFIPVVGIILRIAFNLLLAAILAVTLSPIVACWWTRFYMDRTGIKPKEESTKPPATPAPAPETPTREPIYI